MSNDPSSLDDQAFEAWLASVGRLNLAIAGLRERRVLDGVDLAAWIVEAWWALDRSLCRP